MKYIIAIICFILTSITILQEGVYYNLLFTILNLVIAFICVKALFLSRRDNYSLYKIFYLFVLFFFCIAPTIQFKDGVRLMDTFFSEEEYILTTSLVLLLIIMYHFFYKHFYKIFVIKKQTKNNITSLKLSTYKELLFVFISLSICIYVLYINNFNLISLLFRSGDNRIEQSQTSWLIVEYFCRPMAMIIFLSAYIIKVKHKIVLPILFILMLIALPPTGMARFSVAAIYTPVLLCLVPMIRKGNRFILLMFSGLLIIFPMLDIFRYFNSDVSVEYRLNFDQFKELHFDSYSMFMRVLRADIITYGQQLLGVIFFFIPRSMWYGKPIGSGAMIAESEGLEFTNLSMPYFGEGYINFGFIGILFFVVLLSYITAKIDKWYWVGQASQPFNVDHILYMIILSLLLFILRGDLLSSFAYTCGFVSSFYFIKRLSVK